ncbi:MAG: isochorismatase family protein [Proteobacteria bacterium]|nr:isochorismatase family protein [Burkholderiales bacterium]
MPTDPDPTSRNALGARTGEQWQVDADTADLVRTGRPVRRARIAATPQAIEIDLARSAMVVVDMQNDFCAPGGWLAQLGVDIANARKPIAPLNALLPRLRDADVPVVWVNWGNRPDLSNISPALLHVFNGDGKGIGLGDRLVEGPLRGERVLERGSGAAALVDGLVAVEHDIRIDKVRMSGFWDTELDSVLRNLGIATLLFGGVNADQCVLATLMDANFLGYDTILVEECTATTSPDYCMKATLYNVRQCFGFVVSSAAVIAGLCR